MWCLPQAVQVGGQPIPSLRGHLGGGGVDHGALRGGGNYLDRNIRVARLGAFWKICNGRAHWTQTRGASLIRFVFYVDHDKSLSFISEIVDEVPQTCLQSLFSVRIVLHDFLFLTTKCNKNEVWVGKKKKQQHWTSLTNHDSASCWHFSSLWLLQGYCGGLLLSVSKEPRLWHNGW